MFLIRFWESISGENATKIQLCLSFPEEELKKKTSSGVRSANKTARKQTWKEKLRICFASSKTERALRLSSSSSSPYYIKHLRILFPPLL